MNSVSASTRISPSDVLSTRVEELRGVKLRDLPKTAPTSSEDLTVPNIDLTLLNLQDTKGWSEASKEVDSPIAKMLRRHLDEATNPAVPVAAFDSFLVD